MATPAMIHGQDARAISLLQFHLARPARAPHSILNHAIDAKRPVAAQVTLRLKHTLPLSFPPQNTHCGWGQPPEYSESAEIGWAAAGASNAAEAWASWRTCSLRVP